MTATLADRLDAVANQSACKSVLDLPSKHPVDLDAPIPTPDLTDSVLRIGATWLYIVGFAGIVHRRSGSGRAQNQRRWLVRCLRCDREFTRHHGRLLRRQDGCRVCSTADRQQDATSDAA